MNVLKIYICKKMINYYFIYINFKMNVLKIYICKKIDFNYY